MSRPAQNPRPSPRSSSARTPAAAASSYALPRSSTACSSRAFILPGAFSTTSATLSSMDSSIMLMRGSSRVRGRGLHALAGARLVGHRYRSLAWSTTGLDLSLSTTGVGSLLGVVVDGDFFAGRVGLAGEYVTALDLVRLQRVVLLHGERPGDHLGAAGAADTAGAGERDVRADPERRVEHRLAGVLRRGDLAGESVEREGDVVVVRAGVYLHRAADVALRLGRL